jgi:transposase-like protein
VSPSGVVDSGWELELRIPRVREGAAFFPSLLEPRRRVDQALWAVIMTAYVTGTSTTKVDDLVRVFCESSGISKSTVSRICEQLDEEVAAFRDRTLDHVEFRYLFVDATYLNGRKDHRVFSRAVVVTGVAGDGNREVLDLDVGDTEDEGFWTQFLRRRRKRGLTGVVLVISDAHTGLKNAIRKDVLGSSLVAVPGPFHADPVGSSAKRRRRNRRRYRPHRFRPARPDLDT